MFEDLQKAIIEGNDEEGLALTNKYLSDGNKSEDIIKEGLVTGMNVVGTRFKAYDMYLPEVIMSANAMKKSMAVLKPLISEGSSTSLGKIVIATIEGDMHDIGKNLVSMMLEGAGFELIDLGVDVPIGKLAEAAVENNAKLVGISALLTTTMLAMESAIKEIKRRDPEIKVMVGGAPLTIEFAEKSGADGFAPDALRAIDLAKKLLS
jgi:5-methyltetrahydrofolate--homocysteine methyltransferase